MRYALWEPDNLSVESSFFLVPPHKCVLLSAVRFEQFKHREDASFRVPQMACVERMLYDYIPPKARCNDFVFIPSLVMGEEVASDTVSSGGCYWSLSMCDNMKFVGLPGTYRLRLNDPTAVGTAQVYAELFDYEQIPPQMAGMFFQ